MGPYGHRLHVAAEPDPVARWAALRAGEFPEAAYTFDGGWFYGALRDRDDVMRAAGLGMLIDRLMARERHGMA
jgi:hypothetical protein